MSDPSPTDRQLHGAAGQASNAPPPGQAALPPPGWYTDPWGCWRWWDGYQWGPVAPPMPVLSEEITGKTVAIICHLGMFFGGFILPLIFYLTEGKNNRFVKHHAAEALNFQLTFLIVYIPLFVIVFVLGVVAGGNAPQTNDQQVHFPLALLALLPVVFILWAVGAIFAIVGAVQASKLRWWRYPVRIPFVRGAL